MAVGQAVLTSTLDVGALTVTEGLIEGLMLDRCAAHGRRLRAALQLHAVMSAAGGALGTTSQLALLEQTSEQAAQLLLAQAELLAGLLGGLEAVECGLLTVEQCAVVARKLLPLPDLVRWLVWDKLKARLLAAFDEGAVLTPPRLGELLAGWAIEADPAGAVARRQAAESHGSVDYRRRDDGLADIFLNAITGPNAQAILCRIRARSRPWGSGDTRSAGKRRLDAAVDLLLGRDQLGLDDSDNPFDSPQLRTCQPAGVAGGGVCGCGLGELVPCGVQVSLLVPLGAALGTTDEVAVLEGHGPLEPDLLQAVLHNAPTLRPVWVDEDGVPVAIGDRTEKPPRRDAPAVRAALLRLAGLPAGLPQPRHPDDHLPGSDDSGQNDRSTFSADAEGPPGKFDDGPGRRTTAGGGDVVDGAVEPRVALAAADAVIADVVTAGDAAGDDAAAVAGPPGPARPETEASSRWPFGRPAPTRPRLLAHPHPLDTPGPYRVPTRLGQLLRVRAPRCEWPACGSRSAGCDLDHDRAHPCGPTCGCNVGPACRHHHRIKQLLMTKTRGLRSAVTWTGPTGRAWLSPSQHQPPAPAVRPVRALPETRRSGDPYEHEDGSTDLAWLDGTADRLRADDPFETDDDTDRGDPYERINADGWGLALDDPYRWAA